MRAGIVAALLGIVSFGCAQSDTAARLANDSAVSTAANDTVAVQEAALTELFLVRERASALLVWQDAVHTGPVFDSLGLRAVREVAVPAALAVSRVSLAELEALFAQHPDGWAALYATYPGTPGLVEVGPVTIDGAARTAQIAVGRSCGENCRMAWQLTLTQRDDGAWRVRDVGPVAMR